MFMPTSWIQSNVFKLLSSLVVAVTLLVGVTRASADVLTFDDLPESDAGAAVPNGYGGFNWGNFYYVDTAAFTSSYGPTGYAAGTVSPNSVAANGFGTPASIVVTSSTSFTFDGAYLTAAWNDGLSVEVQGYNSGNLIDDTTVYPSATAPTFTHLITPTSMNSYSPHSAEHRIRVTAEQAPNSRWTISRLMNRSLRSQSRQPY